MIRDIRMHLPQSKQTDPNAFPQYEYQPYPRMMKDANGKPLKDKAGNFVIVNSEAEESRVMGAPVSAELKAAGIHEVTAEKAQPAVIDEDIVTGSAERVKRKYTKRLPADLTS